MEYLSLQQSEIDLVIARNLRAREEEHMHYMLNHDNYKNLLSDPALKALPDEWPDELKRFKKMNRDEQIEAIADDATLAMVQSLSLRDKLKNAMRTEKMEADRIEKYHSQLLGKLPKTKPARDAILAAEKAEREAAKAKV